MALNEECTERSVSEQTWDAVPFGPDLAQDALALCQRTWGANDITDVRYQRWQYEENPAGPALSTFARTRDDGRLVGQFGAVPVRFIINGEERVATLALNVVTDAGHRDRGIFVGLGRAADGSSEANAGQQQRKRRCGGELDPHPTHPLRPVASSCIGRTRIWMKGPFSRRSGLGDAPAHPSARASAPGGDDPAGAVGKRHARPRLAPG